VNIKAFTDVASRVARPMLKVKANSPALLFGAGVVGVGATVFLACRATLKLEDVLTETQENLEKAKTLVNVNYSEEDRKKDIVLLYTRLVLKIARMYGPALVLGVATVGAFTGAHVILNRRNAALTAAYASLSKGFQEYRKRVIDEVGVDREQEIRLGALKGEYQEGSPEHKKVVQKVKDGHSIYARFFDESSRNWSRQPGYNQLFLQCQQNYANDLLHSRGHVFLNEVYDMLGLPRTPEGQIVGWVSGINEGDGFVDFGVFEGDVYSAMRFVNGDERSILLDFNVDGNVLDLI
jgi:Family of unknown function (DUF6353)